VLPTDSHWKFVTAMGLKMPLSGSERIWERARALIGTQGLIACMQFEVSDRVVQNTIFSFPHSFICEQWGTFSLSTYLQLPCTYKPNSSFLTKSFRFRILSNLLFYFRFFLCFFYLQHLVALLILFFLSLL
jgi:hypothetical protein